MTGFEERGEPGSGDGFEDADYVRLGIGRDTARGWRRWGLQPAVAREWLDAGVDDPVDAVRWHPAVQPHEVQGLLDQGMTSDLLARWREHGADTQQALAGHAVGKKPEDRIGASSGMTSVRFRSGAIGRGRRAAVLADAAIDPAEGEEELVRSFFNAGETGMSYLRIGWLDEQAQAWSAAGIEALDARDWLAIGLDPAEAVECESKGLGATDVALQWWRAGFDPEEVALWLGAGLTPEEARAQRDSGVTLEQAAVMRSLRRGERDA